jgi:hypothetical protein
MGFDSAFREEAESFSGVRAFLDAKDLYFQDRTLDVSPEMSSRAPSIPKLWINGA